MSNTKHIIEQLKSEIAGFHGDVTREEIGTVLEVGDGIARVSGLRGVKMSEMVTFEGGATGVALNLEDDTVGIIVLGSQTGIKEGQEVRLTGRILEIGVGDSIIGRVVDPLGKPIDGKGDFKVEKTMPIESVAPGVISRQSVDQPVQTGIKAIDALVPVGRGQRELIIGDRQTGKTAIAIDAILNQRGQNMTCVYVAIGQKDSKLRALETRLREAGAMDYTVIVSAGASDPSPMQYLAPYAGVTVAEYFMHKGQDVLIIYDDLSKHAVAYREISLLLRRPPGREAYPGDVFYLHSRLLERACRRNSEHGGGSITALPIIETQAGDISAYIPTNVISITDGQIFLETDLFYKGVRPAVNVGFSVSRVGGSAQIKAMKKVAGTLKLDLAQFRELEAFAQFGSDLDQATRNQIERGRRAVELLKQTQYSPMLVQHQVISLYALTRGYMDSIPVVKIKEFEAGLIDYVEANCKEFVADVVEKKMWSDESEVKLKETIESFKSTFN
ncbi:MAG: F0F1 ATP synthase subunit alpha [Candidatus Pacebacteria bacterium]|nr:F0F1 ATP synthase subunit alpha [Candidatus Paceibacterota bacterium]MBP9772537.1 F0F1 ATP synthase subunit alpha [Candidatus Paceibacterota bacterium]